MASFKALCLAGVASLVATAAAQAADLLPPPPPVEYAPPPAVIGGNWYLRGDVGIGIANLDQKASTFNPANTPVDVRSTSYFDDAGIIDGGVGYRFNQYFRADVTAEYRANQHYSGFETAKCYLGYCSSPRYADAYTGSVNSGVGLVNGYVDAGTWFGFTPFVGAGVGVAYVGFHNVMDQGFEASSGGFGYSGAHYDTNFAFALMAGLDFAVTQNLKLELSYRYLDEGNIQTGTIRCFSAGTCPNEVQHFHLASNDIRLGFRYTFADFLPVGPGPSLPLIRKY